MFRRIQDLMNKRSEKGASAVEYGLLVALIAAVIVVAVIFLGGIVNGAFEDTSEGICEADVTGCDADPA